MCIHRKYVAICRVPDISDTYYGASLSSLMGMCKREPCNNTPLEKSDNLLLSVAFFFKFKYHWSLFNFRSVLVCQPGGFLYCKYRVKWRVIRRRLIDISWYASLLSTFVGVVPIWSQWFWTMLTYPDAYHWYIVNIVYCIYHEIDIRVLNHVDLYWCISWIYHIHWDIFGRCCSSSLDRCHNDSGLSIFIQQCCNVVGKHVSTPIEPYTCFTPNLCTYSWSAWWKLCTTGGSCISTRDNFSTRKLPSGIFPTGKLPDKSIISQRAYSVISPSVAYLTHAAYCLIGIPTALRKSLRTKPVSRRWRQGHHEQMFGNFPGVLRVLAIFPWSSPGKAWCLAAVLREGTAGYRSLLLSTTLRPSRKTSPKLLLTI